MEKKIEKKSVSMNKVWEYRNSLNSFKQTHFYLLN